MKVLANLPLKESLKMSLRVSDGTEVKVHGRSYNVANLKTFAIHGCKCVRCGREGDSLTAWMDKGGGVHIDVFSQGMLMNRDHIIPRSKKGGNTFWNYQPMCVKCNSKKGNNETKEDHRLRRFRDHWRSIHVAIHDSSWIYIPRFIRSSRKLSKLIVKFRERHLHKVTHILAQMTHWAA